MKVVAVVPAAGSGVRMQQSRKKPYIMLAGQPILCHTLGALNRSACISAIILAVSPGDEGVCREQVLRDLKLRAGICIVAGGKRRQDSVCNALAALPADCDVVLIHDGARPFVTPEIIEQTARAAFECGAATAAVAVKDTIMRMAPGEQVHPEPLAREELRAIQTPQAFRPDVIAAAHARARDAGFQATDDASLVINMGMPVALVAGSYENIKITTPADLIHAAALLRTPG
jgi:2-C-methyl-D-erythritol 4-phosphate cytidylyltransferase